MNSYIRATIFALAILLASTFASATPLASLAPTSIAFGTQAVGILSAGNDIVLSNTGDIDLTITSVAFTGTNSTDFSYTTLDCTSTLPAGTSCTYTLRFTPGSTGARSGNFVVTDNSGGTPGSTQTATLTGTGALATLQPSSQDFGSQSLGGTSGTQTFVLSNGQATQLTVSGIAIGGANAGDFAISLGGTCPGQLGHTTPVPAFGSCTVNVVFIPTVIGTRSATLVATDDAGGTPGTTQTSTLTGTATASPSGAAGHAQVSGTVRLLGNIGGGNLFCGPPLYACFDFSTVPINFSIPGPNFGSNNCDWTSAYTVQLCGNLLGAGTTQTPTDFNTPLTRCTDANTIAGSPQFIWTTYDAPSTNAWNTDDTAFLVKVTGSGTQYLFKFNPATSQCTLLTNGGVPVTFNGGAWFSHNVNNVVYSYDSTFATQLKQSTVNFSTGALTTITLFDFNTANCLLNTSNGLGSLSLSAYVGGTTYAKYAEVTFGGLIYSSRTNGNVGHQPDVSPTQWDTGFTQLGWTGTNQSDITDQEFSHGYSTLAGQGSGIYLAAWAIGQGASSCDVYNTGTNVISHNGTTVGTVSDAPWGGANGGKFDEFGMHDSQQTASATWVTTTASPNTITYGTYNDGNYYWQIGTTNVQRCGIGAPNWAVGTVQSQGDRVSPLTGNVGKYIYQIITGSGGTNGATPPTWNQTPGTDSAGVDGIPWHNVGLGAAQKYACDGHPATLYAGQSTGKKVTYHSFAAPINPQTALLPPAASANAADQHFSTTNRNTTDSNDIFIMSAQVGTGIQLLNPNVLYPSPYFNELYFANPPNLPDGTTNCAYDVITCPHGFGGIRRASHNWNSGWHQVFDVQNGMTVLSQTGKFFMLSTDGMGQFGNIDGTHGSCNVGAPDWNKAASGDGTTTYSVGYKMFPNPITRTNVGDYIYQIQSCSGACATGSVEPTWVQSPTVAGMGTFTDGTITWGGAPDVNTSTNVAKQNCRADIVIGKLTR